MKRIVFIIIFFTIFLSGCCISNRILAKKMIEKYSENGNYVSLTGEIVEISENDVLIKCEELKNYIKYEDEFCRYHIHSEQCIELSVGEEIEFITVPYHFYNGHKLPIVELRKDGKTLLTFEDGKENLIKWVNAHFK